MRSMRGYDHQSIEKKWQERWERDGAHQAREDSGKPKFYALIEFPYPSGDGLHVGHLRSNTAMDIIARKRRMEGYEVLYPIGWDAFGLPAENYALKTGQHPRVTTEKNCANFRRQLQAMGFSFDWSREVNTSDPAYYQWTQWIFLQLLKHGLAYKAKVPINWCPKDKIGLANEEAAGGVCERCGGPVEKRDKEQWMLRITAYADKLLAGLETVDYIERAKVQQRNWIGRSAGAEISFTLRTGADQPGVAYVIPVFTTRPDTLFGVTYIVLAPEHKFLTQFRDRITNWSEVEAYINATREKSDIERTAEGREKTGVECKGLRCVNPATREEVPVWVADYVVSTYGTGAVMAVPAHDERDFAFAKKYGLPIRIVVCPNHPQPTCPVLTDAYTGDGHVVDSGTFTGMTSEDAKRAITERVGGEMVTIYKLRDWVFSRQRYWGEPIPVVFCASCAKNLPGSGELGVESGELSDSETINYQLSTINSIPHAIVPIPEDQLPVKLPNVEKYQPTDTGESPLAAITDWVNTKCPRCGGSATRETDVMPNWAGSSWYSLAYVMRGISNFQFPISKYQDAFRHWLPVDWYNGGMEHTTLHLLYSRFWNLFLHDIGVVPVAEPYKKRTSHGLILAADGEKMSKSRGNVVNPDDIVAEYGADAVRLYEMFIGPFDQQVPWSTDGLIGCRRFLERVAVLLPRVDPRPQDAALCVINDRDLHRTIKKVTDDIESMRFNTAVSTLMEYANALGKRERIPFMEYVTFLVLLSPFAPHLAEELHEQLPDPEAPAHALASHPWPTFDAALIVEEEVCLVVQVNGKIRATITVPADTTEDSARARAFADVNVQKHLAGKTPEKIIYVPGRLLNIVVA